MASVGADLWNTQRCPLCNRTGNGGFCLESVGYPVCTGANERYRHPDCLSLLLANPSKMPSHIAQKATSLALERVLGEKLTQQLSTHVIATPIVPWLIDFEYLDRTRTLHRIITLEINKARLSLYIDGLPSRERLEEAFRKAMRKARTSKESKKLTTAFFGISREI